MVTTTYVFIHSLKNERLKLDEAVINSLASSFFHQRLVVLWGQERKLV